MGYIVKKADGSADLEPLLQLWAENLQIKGDPGEKERWYYQRNPIGPGRSFLLFSQTPDSADQLVGDAIMLAGGPGGNSDIQKTFVRRAGVEIVPRESFADGLTRGLTLDQLNLRAGDEIVLGSKGTGVSPMLQFGVPILSLTMIVLRAAKVY